MVGIVSQLPETPLDLSKPAVLMLNAGILHRVGPSRIHVTLGRELAAAGFPALRFDASGLGDSTRRRDNVGFETAAVLDICEAMDFLKSEMGVSSFVLFGLCSGADAAFKTARAESRIVGLVSIDGFAYRNFRYYAQHYASRLLKAEHWKNFTRRQMWRLLRGITLGRVGANEAIARAASTFSRTFPPKSEVIEGLAALSARGVYQFYIHTGGQEAYYNYEQQFSDSFRSVDFRGKARVEYLKDSDHTFTPLDQQQLLVNTVVEWATRIWGSAPSPTGGG